LNYNTTVSYTLPVINSDALHLYISNDNLNAQFLYKLEKLKLNNWKKETETANVSTKQPLTTGSKGEGKKNFYSQLGLHYVPR